MPRVPYLVDMLQYGFYLNSLFRKEALDDQSVSKLDENDNIERNQTRNPLFVVSEILEKRVSN